MLPAPTAAAEFQRQVDVYVNQGYAGLAGMDEAAFRALLAPLAQVVSEAAAAGLSMATTVMRVPFVVVVTSALVPAAARVPLLTLPGKSAPGVLDRNHGERGVEPYLPLPELGVPAAAAYVVLGVERGDEFLGAVPKETLAPMALRGRTPITIDEGLSLLTVFPEVLEPNRCFMLAGSRQGDKRVPALWISAAAPKLGWCWEGNPHTWLGVASAASRIGAVGVTGAEATAPSDAPETPAQ